MNTQLTSDQIEFYRENGFLIIDDFLQGAELSSWQDAVDEAIAQHVGHDDAYHNQSRGGSYYKNFFANASICGKQARGLNS